jgi:hypothetical protein
MKLSGFISKLLSRLVSKLRVRLRRLAYKIARSHTLNGHSNWVIIDTTGELTCSVCHKSIGHFRSVNRTIIGSRISENDTFLIRLAPKEEEINEIGEHRGN